MFRPKSQRGPELNSGFPEGQRRDLGIIVVKLGVRQRPRWVKELGPRHSFAYGDREVSSMQAADQRFV